MNLGFRFLAAMAIYFVFIGHGRAASLMTQDQPFVIDRQSTHTLVITCPYGKQTILRSHLAALDLLSLSDAPISITREDRKIILDFHVGHAFSLGTAQYQQPGVYGYMRVFDDELRDKVNRIITHMIKLETAE